MKLLDRIAKKLSSVISPGQIPLEEAYNIWSKEYDAQPDNLVLALDEILFASLIEGISFKNKIIADIGCGTGRHWNKIYAKDPASLIGYDVSEGMLGILKKKFPLAKTHLLKNDLLNDLPDRSCDILVSTLAMAHIENLEIAFAEWDRILKPGACLIITDYHPELLAKGGDRTFKHEGKNILVKSYIHSLEKVRTLARHYKFEEQKFIENKIDESVKHFYEKQNALHVYKRFKETSVIYGMYLIKTHAAS